MKKRLLAIAMTLAMALSLLPVGALASGDAQIVESGSVQGSTIHYELTRNDDGADTLTLRFYETDTDREDAGVMPDFAVKDEPEYADAIDKYQNAPWYDDDYRLRITHVIYDESITKTGYLTATHLYKCARFDFLNGNVEVVGGTIYYIQPVTADSVLLNCSVDADWADNAIHYDSETDKAKFTTSYFDVEAYIEKYTALLTMDASNLNDEDRAAIQAACAEYEAKSPAFRDAVNQTVVDGGTFGEVLEELSQAIGEEDVTLVVMDEGKVQNSTIAYELTRNDDGTDTLTLRFYETDTDREDAGVMPDFDATDAENEKINYYQNAPWYARRNQITHVIYDESITRTGYLTAAHLYNCAQYDFLNPSVELAHNTIHINGEILAEAVKLRCSSGATGVERAIFLNEGNGANPELVSISYLEAEAFETQYGSLLAEATSLTEVQAAELKAAFEALHPVCKVQLGVDTLPGTNVTYRDRLDALLEAGNFDPVDDTSAVKTGIIPSPDENETVRYEVTTTDNKTYTVRFWDPAGDGVMPDYGEDYLTLPWRGAGGYSDGTVVRFIFEESINYVGNLVAANMSACTEYEFHNPNVRLGTTAIYFNDEDLVNTEGVTIHAYTTADIKVGKNASVSQDYLDQYIHISYYEAEQFENNTDYADLWDLSLEDAADHATLIHQAYRAYLDSADVVRQQLDRDVIPGTENTTYGGQLSALMAELNMGGTVGSVSYVLSLNEDNQTYTLILSGTGAVGSERPWSTAHAADITAVVLGEGITEVSSEAFRDLTNLTSVDVALTVETIAADAFPEHSFTLYGWLNHASGEYAEDSGVQLRLKGLRVLAMGNSHTIDYAAFLENILGDLSSAVDTEITVEQLVSGGRKLYIDNDDRRSHYAVANDSVHGNDDPYLKYSDYQNALNKTWDLIVIQDYHESNSTDTTYGGANYTDEMAEVLAWLHEEAPGAEIAWFADWADKSGNETAYAQSVEAMAAIRAMENGPDFIIPGSTVLQNARTSYLGKTNNAEDALLNWESTNFNDFAKDKLDEYSLLERDNTHMSLEVGRQLMGTFVLYSIFEHFGDELNTAENFDFFDCLKTPPVYQDGECFWQGEFTDEIWAIIAVACENAWNTPGVVTSFVGSYAVDPFLEKYAQVVEILKTVQIPEELSQESLEAAFRAQNIVAQLAAIEGLNITAEDIVVSYTPPVNGTEDNKVGVDGEYKVEVDCHYGYSYPTEPFLQVTLPADRLPGYEGETGDMKQAAIEKLESYMSELSYAEGDNRNAVIAAKDAWKAAIEAEETDTESEIKAALMAAQAEIDKVKTIFETQHSGSDDVLALGQIWTGGWVYGTDEIVKNDYTLDIEENGKTYDSQFTGVWWLVREDGEELVIEFYPDPAGAASGYSFETPVYNASHWLDPNTQTRHSENPLQYNQTPWFREYRNELTKAVVHSGVTINQHTLACYPNISEYTIENDAHLGTNAIYFNPLQTDTTITFTGASTVEKGAVSSYRVANSYGYYVDVHGDMSKVTIASDEGDGMNGKLLQENLYYAFGTYRETMAWNVTAQAYDPIVVGLAGAGEDIRTGEGFAPHYTDGVDDGTTMLRVFNETDDHSHAIGADNVVSMEGLEGNYPCQTGLTGGYVCTTCHAIVEPQTVVQDVPHTWDSGEVTKAPTTSEVGEFTYTCQVCGATKTETIARLLYADYAAAVGGRNYETLQSAISSAKEGETVLLLRDVTESATVSATKDVLLNLNGHTITGDLNVSGTLTIQDAGTTGKVDGTIQGSGDIQILGGSYTQQIPQDFCAEGYGPHKNSDGTYGVHLHIWDAGTVTTEPTSTTDGEKTYYCTHTGCEAVKTEVIPATGTVTNPTYTITNPAVDGGTIAVSPRSASRGRLVTLTVTPDEGYELASLTVTDGRGNTVALTDAGNGKYTFTMPASRVVVNAAFQLASLPFTDVAEGAWYYDAVAYVYRNGLMSGVTADRFAPDYTLDRATLATILWRLAGEPVVDYLLPFEDVPEGEWYSEAIRWAASTGIVTGTTPTTFRPTQAVTREQMAAMVYRYAEHMGYDTTASSDMTGFTDGASVNGYAVTPMSWSVAEGLISGIGTEIRPQSTATRAQIATMLMRFCENVAD